MLYFFKIYSSNVGKRCRSLLVKLIKQAFIKIYICILIFTSILGGLLSIFVFVFKFLSVFWGAYKAEPHQIWPLSARPRPAFAAIIPFMAFFQIAARMVFLHNQEVARDIRNWTNMGFLKWCRQLVPFSTFGTWHFFRCNLVRTMALSSSSLLVSTQSNLLLKLRQIHL